MTNQGSIWRSRDIALLTKVYIVKAMVFPVVMYGCKSWTIQKAEHWKIDAFELWCWRRLLRVPWTARRSNQSILKEIKCEYSFKGLTLKLELQYFGHLMQTEEKTLMWKRLKAKGEEGGKEGDGQIVSPTQWAWSWTSSRSKWGTRRPAVWPWGYKQSDMTGWLKYNNKGGINVNWRMKKRV